MIDVTELPIVFHQPSGPLRKGLLACAALVALLVVVWFVSPSRGDRLTVMALAAIVIVGMTWLVRRSRRTDPTLIIRQDGFVDDSSSAAAGFVPWTNVASIEVREAVNQIPIGRPRRTFGKKPPPPLFVEICLHDPSAVTRPSAFGAAIAALDSMFYGDIMIPESMTPLPSAELAALMNTVRAVAAPPNWPPPDPTV